MAVKNIHFISKSSRFEGSAKRTGLRTPSSCDYFNSPTDVSYEDGRDHCEVGNGCCWWQPRPQVRGRAVGDSAYCNSCNAQFRIDGPAQ